MYVKIMNELNFISAKKIFEKEFIDFYLKKNRSNEIKKDSYFLVNENNFDIGTIEDFNTYTKFRLGMIKIWKNKNITKYEKNLNNIWKKAINEKNLDQNDSIVESFNYTL